MTEPRRTRPNIPKDYDIPETEDQMVQWGQVVEKLQSAKNYWLCTVRPDGRPHCVPSWGAWIEGKLYFGGGEGARHSRNLSTNPHIVVHLEDGEDATIVEGMAEKAVNVAPEIITRIEEEYLRKYGIRERPNYVFTPTVAFAWYGGLNTATRFLFDR